MYFYSIRNVGSLSVKSLLLDAFTHFVSSGFWSWLPKKKKIPFSQEMFDVLDNSGRDRVDRFENVKFVSAADVVVSYHRGLPRITVPLPSRKEQCVFTLKPITHTVGDLIQMLKKEDRGIDRATVTTTGELLSRNLRKMQRTSCVQSRVAHAAKKFCTNDFPDGIRIGSNNTIESLMENDFRLVINDMDYLVTPPLHHKHTMVSFGI